MSEISSLSTTDASNTARFSEGQNPSTVNDGARALEGMIARWSKDIDGSLVSTGSSNAYALASNRTLTSYAQNQAFIFEANFANTGAATLNVDSIGAKAIKKHNDVALASGDIESGQIVMVVYEAAADAFQMLSQLGNAPSTGIADLVEDTTPQLGGDLDLNGNNIDFPTTANISDCLDEDDMSSDSATALATQQSIKAYVDGEISGVTTGTITLATAQASTSGTTVLFGSIPSGTKRIVMMLSGVSTNSTSNYLVQIGDAGGIENTGYTSTVCDLTGSIADTNSSAGFIVTRSPVAADAHSGKVTLDLLDSSAFTWVADGKIIGGSDVLDTSAGIKSLSAELTQIQLTTVSGDTFDAGSVSISYEQ